MRSMRAAHLQAELLQAEQRRGADSGRGGGADGELGADVVEECQSGQRGQNGGQRNMTSDIERVAS
jgi:hypothetical protein